MNFSHRKNSSASLQLGYQGSNLEMTESESVALPFGDSPSVQRTLLYNMTVISSTKIFIIFPYFSSKIPCSFFMDRLYLESSVDSGISSTLAEV